MLTQVTLEVKGETQLSNLAKKLDAGGVAHKLWTEQPENYPTCLATKPYHKSEVASFLRVSNCVDNSVFVLYLRKIKSYSALLPNSIPEAYFCARLIACIVLMRSETGAYGGITSKSRNVSESFRVHNIPAVSLTMLNYNNICSLADY